MENVNNVFSQFPKLETKRCELLQIIEGVHSTDIFDLFKNECVTRYLEGIETFKSIDDAHSFISLFDRAYQENKSTILWGIRIKESQQIIGIICVYELKGKTRTKIFYALLPQFWGVGFMTKCLSEVTSFCFNQMSIKKIETIVDENNKRSLSVLLKAGYQKDFSPANLYFLTSHI
jgi:[ribosomal protein S5]-alanine N-acetyltransferase